MNDDNKKIIREAKKTLKYYIDFLDRLLGDLNTYNDDKVSKAALAVTCLHMYFCTQFQKDVEKMMADFIQSQSH